MGKARIAAKVPKLWQSSLLRRDQARSVQRLSVHPGLLKKGIGDGMMDWSKKPKGEEIRICLDSGAHSDSRHDIIVTAEDLGFESKADWDQATDEQKMEAVKEYFYQDGWPEWSWDEADE